MVASAFKPREAIFRHLSPLSWRTFLPVDFTVGNFQILFRDHDFARIIVNSVGVGLASTALALIVCSMIAFVLARLPFRGRELLFTLILMTMLIPFEAVMVSLFLVVQRLQLHDSYAALVLPWIADPFIIFLLRQHFKALPRDLEDAAILDGASIFEIYRRIALPNIVPALVSAGFIKFFFSWDAYIWPLIVIQDPDKTVLPVAIGKFFTDQSVLWGEIFAGSVVATLPIVVLFLFLQHHYVQSITSSGIKG